MRKYDKEQDRELTEVVCNQCKKKLQLENGYLREGCFGVDYGFGYFSNKDGMRHRFDLCEDCYEKIIAAFQIPVETVPENEYL